MRYPVQGTLPDNLISLMEVLPVLRTGEAIITGEAARLPMRCRITLPAEQHRPSSSDPNVTDSWALNKRTEGYDRVVASWRAQSPRAVAQNVNIDRQPVTDDSVDD